MFVIKNNLQSKIEIKKSKFLTFIYKIDSEQEAENLLKKVKDEYKDARHILFAYLLEDNKMQVSENKEPVNSMHKVLDLLIKKDLKNILCIVIRYFGGIELGASNLDRTYVSCIFDLLKDDVIEEKINYNAYIVRLKTSYYDSFIKECKKNGIKEVERKFFGNECEVKILSNKNISFLSKYFISYR